MHRLGRALLFGLFLLAAAPAGADEPANLIRELNDDRLRRGHVSLVEHPALMSAAAAHVADMARRGYVDVTAPDGTAIDDRLERAGYPAIRFFAMVVSGHPSAWETAGAVLESRPMAEILLAPGEVRIGVGYHEGPFSFGDGRRTARAWSIIATGGLPSAIADAVPELLRDINRARGRLGAASVRLSDALSRAAGAHADDMVARGYFAHVSPTGGTLADRVAAADYDYRRVGENLAIGQETPAAVVEAWHNSPGHARTMYDRGFDEIGLAYRLGPLSNDGRLVPHVWVAVFGRAR